MHSHASERKPSVAPSLIAQHLARIHDAVWVERALHGAHERELDRGRVALELDHLESPDAMLGAEAAAEFTHQVVNRAPYRLLARQEPLALSSRRHAEVEVQGAVADMAVRDQQPVPNVGVHPP